MIHSNLLDKVRDFIERYDMIEQGDRVVVGLSGGADSTTLLMTLCELKKEYDLEIIAAHLNHGIRGAEADRDEAFCKDLCEKLGVEIMTLHLNIPELAKERGVSEEVAGRDARYEFFAGLLGESGKIATAHNAQDTVETMLLNLCRGTGLKGLTGIPPVRTITHTNCKGSVELKVIRPLLPCTREEIEEFLKEQGQDFVTDSTNLENEYTRNRIRHNVIPELVSVNENAVGNITRCLDTLKDDSIFLENLADELIMSANRGEYYDVKTLMAAKQPVLSRAISHIVYDACGAYPEKVHILKVIDMMNVGRRDQVQVPTGAYVHIEKNKLTVIK